ncbi:conserved hypothetical protein [Coccidioides posadasii str. Silveira]|uniref:Uncharacterized protein n=1 Tax=Coccidioides posadasii (strain RMSCC 757 / Silveira) TaxID=443226 RepID=E9DJH8_COCPS|nr:conserved hypothetical protein [Coccidioides posadasii str. Silveira]
MQVLSVCIFRLLLFRSDRSDLERQKLLISHWLLFCLRTKWDAARSLASLVDYLFLFRIFLHYTVPPFLDHRCLEVLDSI